MGCGESPREMLKDDEVRDRISTPVPRKAAAPRRPQIAQSGMHAVTPARFLARLRYQLLFGILGTVILPPVLYYFDDIGVAWAASSTLGTGAGALVAFFIAIYLFRRVVTLPGVGVAGHVLPALAAGYGIVFVIILAFRLDYSRLSFGMSFVAAAIFFFVVGMYLRRRKGQRFYLVPSPGIAALVEIPNVEWILLREPKLPADRAPVLIADLRAELSEEWERLIAATALAGHPVYHLKQVQESITGRVEIEHLSENHFGSLLPNHSYRKVKRLLDLALALILLPLLIVPGIVVAVMIKFESPGPAFFRQKRRGYRGNEFRVIKFRTMVHSIEDQARPGRDEAITRDHDSRVTRLGRFLRRTRIDELPQIWNILRGEMSWIGPRPEALALSEWYEAELPFYTYRHIVRPGISGWAQVNQGHVAQLDQVFEKLHFDFYYIKNFSAWLDLLILGRTITTIMTGFGAR
jgi:lipopolysaccharide/colanic/teichoic acid biosynthesis glycosyltransferase